MSFVKSNFHHYQFDVVLTSLHVRNNNAKCTHVWLIIWIKLVLKYTVATCSPRYYPASFFEGNTLSEKVLDVDCGGKVMKERSRRKMGNWRCPVLSGVGEWLGARARSGSLLHLTHHVWYFSFDVWSFEVDANDNGSRVGQFPCTLPLCDQHIIW